VKLFLEPHFTKEDTGDGGIRRVVEAQQRYLLEFGVELVDDIAQAEITAGHGTLRPLKPGAPFVSHSHGMYWSDYKWWNSEENWNRHVIDTLVCADAVTVPSEWVRLAYSRGILKDVRTIHHGVEVSEWQPTQDHGGYVLWNKPRYDAVSDPNEMFHLAERTTDVQFFSTLGNKSFANVKTIGRLPYSQMKPYVQNAGVYLATARETFGIGTLEALASGVPVAGWRYGGQREIIREGETGYLADYGDYDALADCVRKCFAERKRLSENARADVEARWQWRDKIEQYAMLYAEVLRGFRVKPQVSIIVTCHNLAKYLPDALTSVAAQSFTDWECLMVDDASADETPKVAKEWARKDKRFISLRSDENLKLSRARNYGFANSNGKYIIHLDADDQLPLDALRLLTDALDRDPNLHIAYGSLDLISEDGQTRQKNPFPVHFNYLAQMAHLNQLHYAAMLRREVLTQVGGYRERMWRAEDSELWCRATSFGFRAMKVTEETTILWRFRADGKSATERKTYPDIDGDWTADFPWATAHNAQDGMQRLRANQLGIPSNIAIPFAAPVESPKVYHRENPLISVIIPLGEGHTRYVIDALDSLVAQTFQNWEAIVVNDSGEEVERIPGAPYARIVAAPKKLGAGGARNLGLKYARAPFVFFLDADDILNPDALTLMLAEYAKNKTSYVYSGWHVVKPDGTTQDFDAPEYDAHAWFKRGQHIVSVLIATEDARAIQFDETMIGFEDWDFFLRCGTQGFCGTPLNRILVTYRHFAGRRSIKARPSHAELVKEIKSRYQDFIGGKKAMTPCCGGNVKARNSIQAVSASVSASQAQKNGFVRMQFIGTRAAPVTYYANKHPYSGGLMAEFKFVDALPEDVTILESTGMWRRVQVAPPVMPVPLAPTPPPEIVKEKVTAIRARKKVAA